MTQRQKRQMVDCPWLLGLPRPLDSVRAQGEETALAICSPYGSLDGRTFPTVLLQMGNDNATVCEQLASYLREHNILPRPN